MGREGVFISHITEESALGTLVKGLLRKTFGDLKVFLSSDHESIESGDVYFNKILSELKSFESIIVLVSKESMNRPWINFEAGVGKGAEALVVPALVRGLAKAEVVPPLSHLQLRDFEDPDDVSGALKDIAKKLNRVCDKVDVQEFVTELRNVGSTLPIKAVSLTPFLQSRASDGYALRFRLANTGNQNIELAFLEACVPKNIVSPNWVPSSDPAVVEPSNCQIDGLLYQKLRYTTYDGPSSHGKHHVERLPSVLLTGATSELGFHFSFPIKPGLAQEERTLPIHYRIGAKNANFPRRTTTLDELLVQLTTVSEKSEQAAKPAEAPPPNEPQRERRGSHWLDRDRTKNWLSRG